MNNPFLDGTFAQAAQDTIKQYMDDTGVSRRDSVTSEELRAGREIVRQSGAEVGDIVTMAWRTDEQGGMSHLGRLTRLDDFIDVDPAVSIPIAVLRTLRVERKKPVVNPFMNL